MRQWLVALPICLLGACGGPPLKLYTLQPETADPAAPALPPHPRIVAVARVTVPEAVDSQDILVRDGQVLRRSQTGRWAARLSAGITDRITAALATAAPGALVTDQPQAGPVTERLTISVAMLDVAADGSAVLAAEWTVIPSDEADPIRRNRTRIVLHGPVSKDAEIVTLTERLVEAAAAKIAVDL